MHLPDIQLDTALALLPKESGLNSVNAHGGRVNVSAGISGGDSFQKLLEKAMNDARAADKARDDERSSAAKEARTRSDKADEARKTDDAPRGAGKTHAADKPERPDTAGRAENAERTQHREVPVQIAEDVTRTEKPALTEDAFAAKFRAASDDDLSELAAWKEPVPGIAPADEADETPLAEQKIARAEDSLLLDALAAAKERHELAPAEQRETAKVGAENEPREEFELKKDSAAKRADARAETMAAAALFNAQAHNADIAAAAQNVQPNAANDGAEKNDTAGAAKKRAFFEGDKPLFTVIDERASSPREKPSHITASHEGNHAELQLSLSGEAKDARLTSSAAQNGGAESKFAAMLSQEIKDNANEFVKAGSIILRDNDSGSIRLALHPKDLGDVKILLQLTDNNIAARITVATKEAYDAFKSSIDSLKQAFNDSGFSTGDFNLSWTGGGTQGNAQHNQHGQEPSRQTFERSFAQYVDGIPDYDGGPDERNLSGTGGLTRANAYAVNIMA